MEFTSESFFSVGNLLYIKRQYVLCRIKLCKPQTFKAILGNVACNNTYVFILSGVLTSLEIVEEASLRTDVDI